MLHRFYAQNKTVKFKTVVYNRQNIWSCRSCPPQSQNKSKATYAPGQRIIFIIFPLKTKDPNPLHISLVICDRLRRKSLPF